MANKRVLARIEELRIDPPPIQLSVADKRRICSELAYDKTASPRDRINAMELDSKLGADFPTAKERQDRVKAASGDEGNVIKPGSRDWSVALQAARQLRNRAATGETGAAQDDVDDDVDTRGTGALPAGSTLPS